MSNTTYLGQIHGQQLAGEWGLENGSQGPVIPSNIEILFYYQTQGISQLFSLDKNVNFFVCHDLNKIAVLPAYELPLDTGPGITSVTDVAQWLRA